MDPILDPGSTTTDHMHIFFGNLVQGTSSFPAIKSGDGGRPNTMETGGNGLAQATNCQDASDTAGYWQPEPYLNGSPYLGPGGGCTTSSNPGSNMHLRVYYLPNATPNANQAQQQIQEVPDGSIMVSGFPNGCNGVTGHGCTSGGFPSDLSIVRYTCGADTKVGVTTPASAWPYDCGVYKTDSDDTFNDGIVAFVNFPDCWNGNADWAPPNNPTGPKVPGYVAPWIPDASAPTDPSTGQRLNDFTYVSPRSSCPAAFPIAVAQIEERMHFLTNGAGFGEPSTCSDEGVQWNTPADNTEWTDKGPAPHPCSPAASPSPNINLSFACNSSAIGGDPNCDVATSQTGCVSPGGTCFIGANPVGWETFHADYWQTWQEGAGDVFGNGTDTSDPAQGAFRDLIEDCTNEGAGACSFINSTTGTPAGRVFGMPENS
jgi:hypothetical protein